MKYVLTWIIKESIIASSVDVDEPRMILNDLEKTWAEPAGCLSVALADFRQVRDVCKCSTMAGW